jgi:hypothetical protein
MRLSLPTSPAALDLIEHPWIDDEVPERQDRRHVGVPEQPVALDQHRHLAAVAVLTVGHPAEVQDPVHRPVGDLGRVLAVGHVQRAEGK